IGELWRLGEHLAIQRNRPLVSSETDGCGCVQYKIIPVLGFAAQEDIDLLMCLQVFLPVDQYANVVQACSAVIRRDLHSGFEELFRFIENVALVLDSAQQPQGLDMVARYEQICAENVLRCRQIAVREQASSPHDVSWQV